MKWIAHFDHPQGWRFEIERQKLQNLTLGVEMDGFYFYVYDQNGFDTHDYLQDTLEIAMEQAFEDFGVPLDAWKRVA